MSKVYETIVLDPNDSVTLRVPLYTLTFDNARCITNGDKDVVTIVLDKMTGKIGFGPKITCAPPT